MDSRLAERFGRNLRHRRRRTGLSQEELAVLAGLSRADIGALEGGKRLPRIDTILKLSAGVGASPCELLAGLRWRPGHYVKGDFCVKGSAEDAARAEV